LVTTLRHTITLYIIHTLVFNLKERRNCTYEYSETSATTRACEGERVHERASFCLFAFFSSLFVIFYDRRKFFSPQREIERKKARARTLPAERDNESVWPTNTLPHSVGLKELVKRTRKEKRRTRARPIFFIPDLKGRGKNAGIASG
jgi:hypothetical protein